MDTKEALLGKNIKEFYSEGISAMQRNSYNSAISLFFKALAVLSDWIIFVSKGFIPKNHSERFRILQDEYPEIYATLDKDFPIYQDSYNLVLSKEVAEILLNDVQRIAKKIKFNLD